jgi:hypothetical protein
LEALLYLTNGQTQPIFMVQDKLEKTLKVALALFTWLFVAKSCKISLLLQIQNIDAEFYVRYIAGILIADARYQLKNIYYFS